MAHKKDIESREDVVLFVDAFYKKVEADPVVGFIFTEIAKVNWAHHLPKMYDFWESVLFGKALFKGNPMEVHFRLNKEQPLGEKEFDRWKGLFIQTIDELFEGDQADETKKKAASIANLMQYKVQTPQKFGIPIKNKDLE